MFETEYFELTDPQRFGDVIGMEGRKHYRFVFGPYKWERTTLFQAYLTEGTPLFGQCRRISQEDAQKLLLKKGKHLSELLGKANQMLRSGRSQLLTAQYIEVAEAMNDWEERLAALLYGVCVLSGEAGEQLRQAGFPEMVSRAAVLLQGTPGKPYGEYLQRVRDDRIARNVKLMELSRETENDTADEAELERCKAARRYLYGDIPAMPETRGSGESAFVPSMEVFQRLRPEAIGGRKIPHGMSNPVLRRSGEKLELAFFVYTYTREELHKGAIHRPVSWITADIASGQKNRMVSCKEEDFSSAPFAVLYSTENSNEADQDLYRNAYEMLDRVRKAWLKNGEILTAEYEAYLSEILKAVPSAYHRFYRELSKL